MGHLGLMRLLGQVRLLIGIALLGFAGAGFLSMLPGRLLVLLFVLAFVVTLAGLRAVRLGGMHGIREFRRDVYRRQQSDEDLPGDDDGFSGARVPRRPSPTSPAVSGRAALIYDDRKVRPVRPPRKLFEWYSACSNVPSCSDWWIHNIGVQRVGGEIEAAGPSNRHRLRIHEYPFKLSRQIPLRKDTNAGHIGEIDLALHAIIELNPYTKQRQRSNVGYASHVSCLYYVSGSIGSIGCRDVACSHARRNSSWCRCVHSSTIPNARGGNDPVSTAILLISIVTSCAPYRAWKCGGGWSR